ncbi:MAG: hypothetical protein JXA07_15715 [Spirochaetes bacterium]|nr:hypothetical protein [Spirochaetota bacterium]
MNIIIFEDGLHDNFYPLSLTRPLWDLRSGFFSFRERLEVWIRNDPRLSGSDCYYFTRDYLAPWFREQYPGVRINDYSVFESDGDALFINAVRYPSAADFGIEKGSALTSDGVVAAACADCSAMRGITGSIAGTLAGLGLREVRLPESGDAVSGSKAGYIWNLVDRNPDIIREDFRLSGLRGNGNGRKDVTISGDPGQVYIEDGAEFDPFVSIDATAGPVVIGSGTKVHSFTRIEGPCVIGRNCLILGAKVRAGTTIGECCRIGGEIEQSIFQGFSNKYHDGFIGHSFVGEWVNLGALTTNSDLKNNYTNVKVYVPGARKRTGLRKVGCFIGDHVKTSIGTLINTGTSIGTGAMLVHAGRLTPGHIPPFSWYMDNEVARTNIADPFISICREAMCRRNFDISENYIILINTVFELSLREKDRQ